MKINVYVDDALVGTRSGCDMQIGDEPCKKTSTATPFFYDGLPRDICESCMVQMAPGNARPIFKTNNYDSITEKHVTSRGADAVALPVEPPIEEAPALPVPAFPSCPKCGERAFTVIQCVAETKAYGWDSSSFAFKLEGDAAIEHSAVCRCRSCGEEGLGDLLAGWIS